MVPCSSESDARGITPPALNPHALPPTCPLPGPQSAREKASAQFRTARSAIMFSSDVSARGVDYPDVTLVLQVGWVGWIDVVGWMDATPLHELWPRSVMRAFDVVPATFKLPTHPAMCNVQIGIPSSREQHIHLWLCTHILTLLPVPPIRRLASPPPGSSTFTAWAVPRAPAAPAAACCCSCLRSR